MGINKTGLAGQQGYAVAHKLVQQQALMAIDHRLLTANDLAEKTAVLLIADLHGITHTPG